MLKFADNSMIAMHSGPWGQVHTVGITSAPIVDVACDAYAVFHPVNGISQYGVARSIEFAGGSTGLSAYADALFSRTTPQKSGELYVTPSGGGNSASLFHMVDGFHRFVPERTSDVRGMFSYLLTEADHRDILSLAIPPIGLNRGEGLTPEQSAAILFEGIKEYWEQNPMKGPYQVLVPLNGRDPQPYTDALESVFGDEKQKLELSADADELAKEFTYDDMARLLDALDDPEKTRPSLAFLRDIVAANPESISERLIERLAQIAERAPAIKVKGGAIIGRDSIPYHFQAMSILGEVARSGGSKARSASAQLAQIGWNRRAARGIFQR